MRFGNAASRRAYSSAWDADDISTTSRRQQHPRHRERHKSCPASSGNPQCFPARQLWQKEAAASAHIRKCYADCRTKPPGRKACHASVGGTSHRLPPARSRYAHTSVRNQRHALMEANWYVRATFLRKHKYIHLHSLHPPKSPSATNREAEYRWLSVRPHPAYTP